MYLYLALFWFVIGVILQMFWTTIVQHAYIPVDRTTVSFFCFLLFSYNLVRWRMARAMARAQEAAHEPLRTRRPIREVDPDLPKFEDETPNPPPG